MRKPSPKVLRMFREAEEVARLLLDLKAEEGRLAVALQDISFTRAEAMAELASRAQRASIAHSDECAARGEKKLKRRKR